ncbi:MAG TPA: PIN domain-containing protein [Kiritimatiellia bacterium]|nr:PIN domain-containing protein [Kiritimatiellia bacterium]HMO98663.1 PIN domain-containing protein [Kiritimatiellia bacterium]
MEINLEAGMLIAFDTAPLIYLIENHPEYAAPVRNLLDQCAELDIGLVTSMITYVEVLTRPEQLGQTELAARYRSFLTNSRNLSLYPFNIQVADECVRYRARYGFNTPDAIQLAVSRLCGARYFVTHDRDLQKIEEVEVVLVSDLPKPPTRAMAKG